jgi:hypothetical protein
MYPCLFLVLALRCFATESASTTTSVHPNFRDNCFLNKEMQSRIAPHLLPSDHPMRLKVDAIFSQSRVVESKRTLLDAGFVIIAGPMPHSFVIVARHPEVPGYVFKLYPDSEKRCRKNVPHWRWLVRRCEGAQGIRNIIKRKNIRHFTVPDKWLCVLPVYRSKKSEKIYVLHRQPDTLTEQWG